MAQAHKIIINYDDDALAIIDKFNAVLRSFGLNVVDTTKDDDVNLSVIVTDGFVHQDTKLWGQ